MCVSLQRIHLVNKAPFMHLAERRKQQPTGFSFEVLSSLVVELVDHYERHFHANETCNNWESPSSRTKVTRYGTRSDLRHVLIQQADAIAMEYQLSYRDVIVYSWYEYRWPQLCSEDRKTLNEQFIDLPQACVDELMNYHIQMKTPWLDCYRARSQRIASTQFDEIRVVA